MYPRNQAYTQKIKYRGKKKTVQTHINIHVQSNLLVYIFKKISRHLVYKMLMTKIDKIKERTTLRSETFAAWRFLAFPTKF